MLRLYERGFKVLFQRIRSGFHQPGNAIVCNGTAGLQIWAQ